MNILSACQISVHILHKAQRKIIIIWNGTILSDSGFESHVDRKIDLRKNKPSPPFQIWIENVARRISRSKRFSVLVVFTESPGTKLNPLTSGAGGRVSLMGNLRDSLLPCTIKSSCQVWTGESPPFPQEAYREVLCGGGYSFSRVQRKDHPSWSNGSISYHTSLVRIVIKILYSLPPLFFYCCDWGSGYKLKG